MDSLTIISSPKNITEFNQVHMEHYLDCSKFIEILKMKKLIFFWWGNMICILSSG